MKRRGLEPMHDEHVNVTPLIDVVMCLIVFFLMCSHLARSEANDQVVLPRAELGQEMSEQRGRLVINIFAHGEGGGATRASGQLEEPEIYIRGEQFTLGQLTGYLRKEKLETPDLKVVLRADEGLSYTWISPVLLSCVQANIRSIHFSTRRE